MHSIPRATNTTTMDRLELERELERLHPASFGWALGCCRRDREEAEETLQTVYVKILEGKARFDGRSSVKTWLFSVIRNTALSRSRTRWLRQIATARWTRLDSAPAGISPQARLERSESTSALLAALRRLARRQREILELVFYHDMTVEQAAETAGISVGSARVHYHRGKQRLERLLGGEEDAIERLRIESAR